MGSTSTYAELVEIRPEVLTEQGLLDRVDLVDLTRSSGDGKRLGDRVPVPAAVRDPASFFGLTYPTEDVQQTLAALDQRFRRPHETAGTILLTGRYGLGKSHILLAAHHALSAPAAAAAWAADWGLEPLELPADVRVVTRSFIQKTADNLWDVVFEVFGREPRFVGDYPDGDTIEGLLDARATVLIFDELERWFLGLPPERQGPNQNFLQALSEVAARDPRITLLTSVLGEKREPAETLRRVRPLELVFRSATDRQKLLAFRLFTNARELQGAELDAIVDAHVGAWQAAGLSGLGDYRDRLRETWPFSPEFIDIVTKKIPLLGGFQNTRGSLRFLSRIVRATYRSRLMITSGNLPLDDRDTRKDLRLLDHHSSGELIKRALGDNYEAVPVDVPHRDALFSALVFYSIADQDHPGATEDDLMLAVLGPDDNPNVVRDSLNRIKRLAYNLHPDGRRLVFRTRENPRARINAMAQSPAVRFEAECTHLTDALYSVWGDKNRTLVFGLDDADFRTRASLRKALETLANEGPCFLIATRKLTPAERLELQNIATNRNRVMLIEPSVGAELRDGQRYRMRADEALLSLAKRVEACNILIESGPEEEVRRVYQTERDDAFKRLGRGVAERFGLYVAWHRAGPNGASVDDSWYELATIEAFEERRVRPQIAQNFTGLPHMQRQVKALWRKFERQTVARLAEHFDRTPGEPVPLPRDLVTTAVLRLARKGELGLSAPDGQIYAYQVVDRLSQDVWSACHLVDAPTSPGVPPPKPETLPTHPRVMATYVPANKTVALRWQYPEESDGHTHRTLVQRHLQRLGREPGQIYPVDLDTTHDATRYNGDGDSFVDDENLVPGVWYHYYVYLVDAPVDAPPRVILSRICDVEVPEEKVEIPDDQIRIPPQQRLDRLHAEIEKKVRSRKIMPPGTTIRRAELGLSQVEGLEPIDALADALSEPATVKADLAFRVTGPLDADRILALVRKLPQVQGLYTATLFLDPPEEGS